MLRELAGRAITHQTLDERLPSTCAASSLPRGILDTRDEHMMRLEQWVDATIAKRTDLDEQHLLRPVAHAAATATTHTRRPHHPQPVRPPPATPLSRDRIPRFAGRTRALARERTPRQPRRMDRQRQRHTAPGNPALPAMGQEAQTHHPGCSSHQMGRSLQCQDTEARWGQTRRLLHDETIKPEVRLAAWGTALRSIAGRDSSHPFNRPSNPSFRSRFCGRPRRHAAGIDYAMGASTWCSVAIVVVPWRHGIEFA